MLALRLLEKDTSHTDRIQLQDIKTPEPKENEVLIQMQTAALNRRDQWIREGLYPGIRPATLGADGCGIVVKTGANAKKWESKTVIINPINNWGDDERHQSVDYHILGMPTDGTFAEFLCVNQDRLVEKPKSLSLEEAAALPLAGLTAFRSAFYHGGIQKGSKVLISGAGGGVAQFAFQFAVAVGAEVFVTSGDDEKLETLEEMGAAGTVNYKDTDWNKQLKDKAGSFDCAIDSAGGETFAEIIKLLGRSGRIIFYGATLGLPQKIDLYRMFFNQIRIQGSTMGSDKEFIEMVNFVEKHKIKPIIGSVTPFSDIISAFDTMKDGEGFGKLVVSMK